MLAPYVDGALPGAACAQLVAHLDGCRACSGLLEEVRVVDALLVTARPLEPPPNFTFRVMAEVRALPSPRLRRASALGVVATYLAFAWLLIGAFFLFGGANAKAALALVAGGVGHYARAFDGLSGATAHLFGGATFGVTAAMSAILFLDVIVAALAVAVVCAVRGRPARAAGRTAQG
jgi:hypothetical protein